ncbi:MAG TPA: hypothetical protein VKY85_01375 [Candidatus Angelobacter sp.]|nr:hypothetical protein [Candidatus Angelobacter sp.]
MKRMKRLAAWLVFILALSVYVWSVILIVQYPDTGIPRPEEKF